MEWAFAVALSNLQHSVWGRGSRGQRTVTGREGEVCRQRGESDNKARRRGQTLGVGTAQIFGVSMGHRRAFFPPNSENGPAVLSPATGQRDNRFQSGSAVPGGLPQRNTTHELNSGDARPAGAPELLSSGPCLSWKSHCDFCKSAEADSLLQPKGGCRPRPSGIRAPYNVLW